LLLREHKVSAAGEWTPQLPGWLFLRVHNGSGYLWRPAKPVPVDTGDMVVLCGAASAPLRASQLGEMALQYFQVLPELLTGLLSAMEWQRLAAANAPESAPRHFAATSPLAQQFASMTRGAAGNTLLLRCQMLHLTAVVFAEHLPATDESGEANLSARERFEQLVLRMPAAELQYRSITELAKMCGCSVRHFSRLFRDYFGQSLAPKKTELRLQRAQSLLADTNAKIIDVAMDSGFQHVGLFTTVFKREFGVTPSEWRRRRQSKRNGKKPVAP
jgi:AraC-like DNA-binding protein